jgi:hypothetical protein
VNDDGNLRTSSGVRFTTLLLRLANKIWRTSVCLRYKPGSVDMTPDLMIRCMERQRDAVKRCAVLSHPHEMSVLSASCYEPILFLQSNLSMFLLGL